MASPIPDGLIALSAATSTILDHLKTNDPAAVAACRYRLIWSGVTNGTVPAVRVGARWFLRRAELPAIVAALGVVVPAKPARAKRAASPSNMAAAA